MQAKRVRVSFAVHMPNAMKQRNCASANRAIQIAMANVTICKAVLIIAGAVRAYVHPTNTVIPQSLPVSQEFARFRHVKMVIMSN